MKYFDVVANRRACSWRDVKAISPKPPKVPTANETAIYWRHDVINMVWSLRSTGFTSPCRKAEPIRNFSVSFFLFFPCWYPHLFVIVHESVDWNSNKTEFNHGFPASRFTTVCTRLLAWMFIILSSIMTCIKCRLSSSLLFSDSRSLFNESLTSTTLSTLQEYVRSWILCVPLCAELDAMVRKLTSSTCFDIFQSSDIEEM